MTGNRHKSPAVFLGYHSQEYTNYTPVTLSSQLEIKSSGHRCGTSSAFVDPSDSMLSSMTYA